MTTPSLLQQQTNNNLHTPFSCDASLPPPFNRQNNLQVFNSQSQISSEQFSDPQRPSTAPTPQANDSVGSTTSLKGSDTKKSKLTRASSTSRSPINSALQVPKRSRPQYLSLKTSSPHNNKLANLLSPTSYQPRSVSSLSRSSSQSDQRSQSTRRPPASFSSNGIETSHGPPPALITSRNPFHSDLARLAKNPAASTLAAQQQKPYHSNTFPVKSPTHRRADSGVRPQSRGRTSDTPQNLVRGLLSPTTLPGQPMDSLNALLSRQSRARWHRRSPSDQSHELSSRDGHANLTEVVDEGMHSNRSSEDMFLQLASESQQRQPGEVEEHDQQAADHTDGHPTGQVEMSDIAEQFANLQVRGQVPADTSLIGNDSTKVKRRNSSPVGSSALNRIASQPSRSGYRPSGAVSVVGVPTRAYSVIAPEHQPTASHRVRYNAHAPRNIDTAIGHRRASGSADQLLARNHQQRTPRMNYMSPTESELSPRTRPSFLPQDRRTEGGSIVSTVQSNVWDDMQDLKSHAGRLENRAYVHGAAGSNGSGERPRTATTTVTTISSSPKVGLNHKAGAGDFRFGPETSNVHPNLHLALVRCKTVVSPAVYRALESAAAEALEMAALPRTTGPTSSIYGSNPIIAGERQMKRKGDNICRSLTDLCVALGEAQLLQQSPRRFSSQSFGQRRDSREIATPISKLPVEMTLQRNYSRQQSLEPEEYRPADNRPTSSRALERLAQRRISMASGTPASSPREVPQTVNQSRAAFHDTDSPSAQTHTTTARSGTSLLRPQHQQPVNDNDAHDNFRAPSRAVTEIGSVRKRGERLSSLLRGNRTNDDDGHQLPISQHAALRRLTGGQPTPTTPISSSSSRGSGRLFGSDRLNTSDATDEEYKKAKRRSFNLNQHSAADNTISRAHNLGSASLASRRTSLAAE